MESPTLHDVFKALRDLLRRQKERVEEPKKQPQPRVLYIQAMHRRVVDVCRSDGRTTRPTPAEDLGGVSQKICNASLC